MNRFSGLAFLLTFLIAGISCESEKRIPPKGYLPQTSQATESLEAAYFWIPQNKVESGYWKDAPYLEVTLENEVTGNLHPEGYLNTTGTYDGLKTFNKGNEPELKIRAGYDDEYIYIHLEWKDTTLNATYMSRVFVGPDDPLKTDTTGGWTSQGNQDSFQILFDMDASNDKDTWKWSMATTAPFDMALNLNTTADGELIGDNMHLTRNGSVQESRIAPSYEWNGERQEIVLSDGSTKTIDPAYYLIDDFKTDFTGDPVKGQKYFNQTASCSYCHGMNGNGISEDPNNNEGPVNIPSINAYSREGLEDFIANNSKHTGKGPAYFGKIKNDPEKVNDLLSFIRGAAGLPGYLLKTDKIQSDIIATSNVGTISITSTRNSRYQVLLRRKLQNGKKEDIQFDADKTYTFSIRLTDNDDINYVGTANLELIFKGNEL